MTGLGKTPSRDWVPSQPGIQSSVAASKGEWRVTPPSCSRYATPDDRSSVPSMMRAGLYPEPGTLLLTPVAVCFRSESVRSPRSIAPPAGRDGSGLRIPSIRSHESATRPSQSARLPSVSGGGSATSELAVDSRAALAAAKAEILELRKQLGLPDELPRLQPPVAFGRHVAESPGGFTPEPGMPQTAGSSTSDAVSLPGSPRNEQAESWKYYGGSHHLAEGKPAADRSELSSAVSSAWSERSALIRAKFKPTQQLFEQRFSTPRLMLTRGGRTRIVPPRNVTRYELIAQQQLAAAAAASLFACRRCMLGLSAACCYYCRQAVYAAPETMSLQFALAS